MTVSPSGVIEWVGVALISKRESRRLNLGVAGSRYASGPYTPVDPSFLGESPAASFVELAVAFCPVSVKELCHQLSIPKDKQRIRTRESAKYKSIGRTRVTARKYLRTFELRDARVRVRAQTLTCSRGGIGCAESACSENGPDLKGIERE